MATMIENPLYITVFTVDTYFGVEIGKTFLRDRPHRSRIERALRARFPRLSR